MRIVVILILFFINCTICTSQEKILSVTKTPSRDALANKGSSNSVISDKSLKNNISNYLIISQRQDTTYVDTTLTIQKEYKYNYLRKDNFNLIQFANVGQTYNSLSSNQASNSILPLFAAQARHFNYMETEAINYYNVPTPLTELFYKTVLEQGQILDAFFTVNTSQQFNFSLAYKGLRSLGNYQHALTSTGNFRFTTNYKTKDNRYTMRGHVVLQDLFNQENGGLTDADVTRFVDGDPQIADRSVLDPSFENAENILIGKRFLLDQSYALISKRDSVSATRLSIDNLVSFEDKNYEYDQSAARTDFFGAAFSNPINDKVTLEHFYTSVGLTLKNKTIGDVNFQLNYNDINYGYNSLVILDQQTIVNRIKTNFLGFQGSYQKKLGSLLFDGSIGANLSDEIKGNFIDGNLAYQFSEVSLIKGSVNINSRRPNFNHLLYQSDYINYNWDNQAVFDNVQTQQIALNFQSYKFGNAEIDLTNINNFTYFELETITDGVRVIKPEQYNESIQYLRVKLQKEFQYGKFALDNTIMYQKVLNGDSVLNVPTIIARNTLYYTDEVFKKALKFQAGVIFNYFSEYNANGYDPLLAEFYTQNETLIGGFPRLDFFINAKVRQTRIYLKAEHFNASFTGNNYFSAPNHPYRDFTVRFGLVWNFFL